jgi:SAM-dependent methyltransferase
MAEWFKDWFNTPEYLDVYKHRNQQDAEELINLILENVNLPERADVLDMACGTGRHSILFASKGYEVTAFDYSELLLREAKRNAAKEKLIINFKKSDIRDFSFDKKFDLIVNLFTSFGYFEEDSDNFNIFNSAYIHLKKNGHFVLDFFNSGFVRRNLVTRTENSIPGGSIIQERFIDNGRIKKRISVIKNKHTDLYYEDVRLYSFEELRAKFIETGFIIRKVFGDFKGNPFDSETSPRVIIIASK